MAVRLSQEELLQDIEQLDSGEKNKLEVALPTERGYEIVISFWDDYACRVGEPELVPNEKWMKGFFKTLAKEHKGRLGPLLSVQTLTTYLTRLKTVFERDRDVKIPPQDVIAVRKYIEKDLKTSLKLSNKTRTKPVMASQDLDTLLHFLWAKDQHIFRQELTRVKLHLYLLILAYTAARTGAVIVSDAYRNSNEALLYKDLKFHLCRDEEGGPPNMSLTITFNLMKNDRDKEDEFITITLWEDRAYPHLCPITFFLTLAFEHKAFDVEPEELYYATIERDVVEIKFKDTVLDTPLFRSLDGTTAWTYASCYSALTGLTYRAGYRCQVTSYSIRRGAANILDKSATWAETGLILGHKNPKVLQSKYANRHLGVSLQELFHNRPTGNDRVRPLRTLAVEHFPGAPSDLRGTEQHQNLRQHPDYLAYRQKWEYLKQSTANKALISAAKRKMDSKLAQLRRNETKKQREAWINTDGSRYLRSQQQGEPRQETATGDSTKNNPPPWRISITEILFKSSVDQSQEERLKLFHSLKYLSIIKPPFPLARTKATSDPRQ
ncbi:hypothetical protein V496_01840 [Pseudogymnoascus sp. VKM F-4515 (FW-2607)]|nr:hypothetical protein V496_01840 [Pseudogymnoascus sp. VKM F-4515 (FW-2607)]